MQATTRGALLRDSASGTDDLGDDVDVHEPLDGWDDFPLSVIERGDRVFDQASGEARTVRYIVGRAPADLPVQDGDRIRDNRTGFEYIVDETQRQPRGLSGRGSLTLSLRRTGS
jgi:hypothetical protein